jgi:hypothetical protein
MSLTARTVGLMVIVTNLLWFGAGLELGHALWAHETAVPPPCTHGESSVTARFVDGRWSVSPSVVTGCIGRAR